MVRGEIYLANLNPASGSEQSGMRPFLIVSRNAINENAPIVIGVPVTGREHKRRLYPTHVELKAGEGGLAKDSVVLCEQVRSISKARLGKRIGSLPPGKRPPVDEALRIALDL